MPSGRRSRVMLESPWMKFVALMLTVAGGVLAIYKVVIEPKARVVAVVRYLPNRAPTAWQHAMMQFQGNLLASREDLRFLQTIPATAGIARRVGAAVSARLDSIAGPMEESRELSNYPAIWMVTVRNYGTKPAPHVGLRLPDVRTAYRWSQLTVNSRMHDTLLHRNGLLDLGTLRSHEEVDIVAPTFVREGEEEDAEVAVYADESRGTAVRYRYAGAMGALLGRHLGTLLLSGVGANVIVLAYVFARRIPKAGAS